MTKKTNDTKIIILGGLGEVGKNMYCVMHEDEIIIIDSGISFPDGGLLGIDYILPDFSFLKQNQDKIKALVITHGHEDHIGGIPFLVQSLEIPAIYAPNQAKELISLKLQDKNIRYDNLFVYDDKTVLKFKHIQIEFFRTTHSIPDSHGILIKTPNGNIVTTGDFKFDFTPIGPMADIHKMARIGENGVDLLISDSTNALNEGMSISETKVDNALNDIFDKVAAVIFFVIILLDAGKGDRHNRRVFFGKLIVALDEYGIFGVHMRSERFISIAVDNRRLAVLEHRRHFRRKHFPDSSEFTAGNHCTRLINHADCPVNGIGHLMHNGLKKSV